MTEKDARTKEEKEGKYRSTLKGARRREESKTRIKEGEGDTIN